MKKFDALFARATRADCIMAASVGGMLGAGYILAGVILGVFSFYVSCEVERMEDQD